MTDLHNYEFGSKNHRLVEKVKKEKPDAILLTGDMLNEDEMRADIVTNLIKRLVQIAPVYTSLDNHEVNYMQCSENPLKNRTMGGQFLLQWGVATIGLVE